MMRFVIVAALVAACSGGGGDDRPDGRTTADAPAGSCTPAGFSPFSQTAERDAEILFYTGVTEVAPTDRLTVDFYFTLGATDGPHTFTFTGEDLAACGTCVLFHRGEDKKFMAQTGTLEVTALGAVDTTFAATLHDVTFAEVTIQDSNTTLVPGGETTCLEEQALSAPITAP